MSLEQEIAEAVEKATSRTNELVRELAEEVRMLRRILPAPFGSKKEAARILGVSERSVERAIERGEIEAKRVGSRVLIDLSKLHADQADDELHGRRAAAGR